VSSSRKFLHSRVELLDLESEVLLDFIDDKKDTQSSTCRIEDRNFTILHLMSFGVIATAETWRFKSYLPQPYNAEARLTLLANLLDSLQLTPKAVILSSALWDLATRNIEAAVASEPESKHLSWSDVDRYMLGLRGLIGCARRRFPHSLLIWKTVHNTRARSGAWFYRANRATAFR